MTARVGWRMSEQRHRASGEGVNGGRWQPGGCVRRGGRRKKGMVSGEDRICPALREGAEEDWSSEGARNALGSTSALVECAGPKGYSPRHS